MGHNQWLFSFITFALVSAAGLGAEAGLSCSILKAMDSPSVRNNVSFWESFAKLSTKGEAAEKDVIKLLQKHGVDTKEPIPKALTGAGDKKPGTGPKAGASGPQVAPYSMSSKAAKDLEKIRSQRVLSAKFEEFLNAIPNGAVDLHTLGSKSKGWGLERLAAEYGSNTYSVRLNHGYRVVFETNSEGGILIKHISKTVTHKN